MKTQSPSKEHKQELDAWFADSEYCDLKLFVAPNKTSSDDECINDALMMVKLFELGAFKRNEELSMSA